MNLKFLYISIFLILANSLFLFSQERNNYEALYADYLEYKKEDTSKVRLLTELSRLAQDKVKALYFAKEALELSNKLNFPNGKIVSYNALALVYYEIAEIADAFSVLNKAIYIADSTNDIEGKDITHRNFATMYLQIQELKQAALHIELATKYAYLSHNKVSIASILYTTGNYHLQQGDNYKAIEYFKKSKEAWAATGEIKLSGLMSSIGNVYFKMGDYNKAISTYFEILTSQQKLLLIYDYGYIYNNIGMCYTKLGDKEKAYQYLKLSLEFREKAGTKVGIVNTYNNQAQAFLKFGEYEKAIEIAQKSFEISRKQSIKDQAKDALDILVDTYVKLQDYKKAYTYQIQLKNYNDSLINEEKIKFIADANARIINERNIQENKVLTEKQEFNQRLIRTQGFAIFFIIILVLVISFLAYKQFSQRKKIDEINLALVLKNHEIEAKNDVLTELNIEINEQKIKLEDLNNMKDKLYSIVAHDTRSPLSSLFAVINLYNDGMIQDSEIPDFFRKISDAVKSTWNFLDNLLFWVKSQMQGVEVNKTTFELSAILNDVVFVLKTSADNKNITIENSIIDQNIKADENMIMLVLRNLINNAIKFTRNDGKIKIWNEIKNKFMVIHIEDNGVGILEEYQDNIFEYKKSTNKGTGGEYGSGLGLILCKEFVEKNGGNIWLKSDFGKGSIFSFTIPLS